ncbi:MAG: apolipoprotein N-acyltransferase [Elusimicrobiota bacterium]
MGKIFLCVLSAILIIFSFPIPHFAGSLWFLAWISLVPLFLAIQNDTSLKPLKSFLYGTLTGLVAYCGILYWLVQTFSAAGFAYGEPKIIGIAALLLLSLYLALYYGLFCLFYTLYAIRYTLLPAFLWISMEFLRTRLFTGFPWALLGYSQWNNLPIIQISEFTGVYGVSFLIVLVNLTIANIIVKKERTLKDATTNFLLILICLIFGFYKLRELRTSNSELRTISILQGNIDQYKKWDETYEQEIVDTYSRLSLYPIPYTLHPALIVWPESSLPNYLRYDEKTYNWIKNLVKKTKTQHLVASNDYKDDKIYNSAFLISADGKILDDCSKNHLVPFGEYMPLRNFFGKFIKVVNEIGEFSSDSNRKHNVINSSAGKLGVNICFEAIFPNEVRKSVKNGAEIIVNLTNDAWYLKTSAPYQHFTMNVFRAVENRRFVVRAANTGISGFIDPFGRIKSKTEIFTTTTLTDNVMLDSKATFYSKFGDIFAYLCVIISIIFLTLRKKFDKL